MDRTEHTSPDSDTSLDAEIQPDGPDALQMTNTVGVDRSSFRRSCARAWNGRMKNRRAAPKRQQLGRDVALRLCARLLHHYERSPLLPGQSSTSCQQLRSTRISLSSISLSFRLTESISDPY